MSVCCVHGGVAHGVPLQMISLPLSRQVRRFLMSSVSVPALRLFTDTVNSMYIVLFSALQYVSLVTVSLHIPFCDKGTCLHPLHQYHR